MIDTCEEAWSGAHAEFDFVKSMTSETRQLQSFHLLNGPNSPDWPLANVFVAISSSFLALFSSVLRGHGGEGEAVRRHPVRRRRTVSIGLWLKATGRSRLQSCMVFRAISRPRRIVCCAHICRIVKKTPNADPRVRHPRTYRGHSGTCEALVSPPSLEGSHELALRFFLHWILLRNTDRRLHNVSFRRVCDRAEEVFIGQVGPGSCESTQRGCGAGSRKHE